MSETLPVTRSLTQDQTALIKRTVCRGADDDEMALFLHAAARTGLDPLMKQIYAVMRWDSRERRKVMSIQTGIDGFRLVAERTGRYAPGREPSYSYADEARKRLVSATSYVKKLTQDGTWHEVAATAFLTEYEQLDKDGNVTRFWARMPHLMLAKCAEALALRRAFPMELSGIYSTEEMAQAGPATPLPPDEIEALPPPSDDERIDPVTDRRLRELIGITGISAERICAGYHVESLDDLTVEQVAKAVAKLEKLVPRDTPTDEVA